MSSLASQLQNIASLDAGRLTSRGGHPSSKSYLFPPKVAASHDLDAIYALAQSGYEELLSLDPELEQFEDELFSEGAKATDRMLLNKEENAALDIVLERCLRRLGRWVGIMAGGKCIEWLVRRFRVHELNAETLLQVFLPYHSSPNFPRILAILTLKPESAYFAPFAPLVKNAQPVPRSFIASEIAPEREKSLRLLNDVARMVKQAVQEGVVHRALLAFWSGIMVDLLESGRSKGINEGMVKLLVETFVDLLSTEGAGADVNAAVYPSLILLTRCVRLADEPFLAVLTALLTPESGANPSQRLLTLLVLLEDRKGWTKGFGADGPVRLGSIKQVGGLLASAVEKYGFENAVTPIVRALAQAPVENRQHIVQIIDAPLTPGTVKALALKILGTGSAKKASDEIKEACRDLLSSLRERYPVIVDTATMETPNVDRSLIEKPAGETALLNVLSADVTARVDGINALFKPILEDGIDSLPADDLASTRLALTARLTDSDIKVLEALYASPKHREAIVGVCGTDEVVQALSTFFAGRKLPDQLTILHLEFACNHLIGTPEASRAVFEKLLFPVLLSSSSRHLSKHAWGVVKASGLARSQVVQALCQIDDLSAVSASVLAVEVARPIAASQDLAAHADFLLSQLDSPVAASKLLAHLVLANVIKLARGEQQVALASRALARIQVSLTGPIATELDVTEKDQIIELDTAARKDIESRKLAARAALLLLFAAGHVVRPSALSIEWLADRSTHGAASAYKALAGATYSWANSAAIPPVFATTLLQSLFAQLREETLLFLASIWTSPTQTSSLRLSALKHAGAFVRAYAGNDRQTTDFQLILPSLLIALTDREKGVRDAALAVISQMVKLAHNPASEAYALESIYGHRSDQVQLLKHADLVQYIGTIKATAIEISVDAKRLPTLHAETLNSKSADNRKATAHRRAMIGSILSHTVAWRSLSARLAIVSMFTRIRDAAVLRSVLPLLLALKDDKEEATWFAGLAGDEKDRYLSALLETLSQTSATVLQENDARGWKMIKATLIGTSDLDAQLRPKLLERLEKNVFSSLSQDLKIDLVECLVASLSVVSSDEALTTRVVLSRLHLEPAALVRILHTLAQPLETSSQRKKVKHDDTADNSATKAVHNINTLIESRQWSNLPGDAQLLASLMALLSTLLAKRQAIKEGIDYLEQEILGALLALVEKITDTAEIVKAHIGIEVIIKVIRASSNPRTSQRALLVAAELARLIPEAVLHNIMPIFTFMGASDLQRDDAYSFGVVEKTVSKIVPVMTRSLRDKASNKLELYTESKTFISIFTDMAARLPRHRTLPFFVHLVKSLGADDYLAPICMLLVQRSTTKAGRGGQTASEVVELPQGVAATFQIDTRLEMALEVILETARMVVDLGNAEAKTAFLHVPDMDEERTVRQLVALLSFASHVSDSLIGKPCDQSLAEELVKQLLLLASTVIASSVAESGVDEIVQECLGNAMSLLSAHKFLGVVKTLLHGENEQDKVVALSILVERLPRVKPEIRAQHAAVISDILKHTAALVLPTSHVNSAALSALEAIASSAQKTEDAALAEIVPKLITAAGALVEVNDKVSALSIIETAVRHLSSRVIPYIQSIVDATLKLIQGKSASSVIRQAFALQSALFDVVPTFIGGKQLTALLRAAITYDKDDGSSKSVITASAKKIPTKTIFPVVMELWKSVQSEGQATLLGFFNLLRLVLRHADRAGLPGLVKSIFAFFLDVFDLRHRLQQKGVDAEVVESIESSAIGSFLELVTKLNEATFKPLFIRLYDWAVVDLAEGKAIDDARLIERKIVLLHVMKGLLVKFKNLLSPYIGTLMPHIEELLDAFLDGSIDHQPLWTLVLDVLGKSFDVDDGAYWTDSALAALVPKLVEQLEVYPESPIGPECLASLAGAITNELTLKSLNTAVCMLSRSDTVPTRLAALRALGAVWDKQSEELLQFVPETVSEFLAELIEDENGDVELLARDVIAKIEKVTGSLKEYLE